MLFNFPSLIFTFSNFELNLTSPPNLIISFLIFLTTPFNKSVPTCGFPEYIISSGAPAFTSSSKTYPHLLSFILVVSLPSENAPAPPSPNCTFDSRFSLQFPIQNSSTVFVLESTSSPLSITIGLYPYWASLNAENIPAGPNPTTTGLCSNTTLPDSTLISSILSSIFISLSFSLDTILFSPLQLISME